MAQVTKEAGIQLVLVRCKNRKYAETPDHEPESMKRYTQDLARYLQERRVHFLDYVHVPDIKPGHFAGGDHLNEDGRQAWTDLMIEDLTALLAGQRAPRELTNFATSRPAE
ncbi:MAG: hypothetical protein HN742_22395 [Lentisphaerae bacterium]|jgi:hypothetical protein|nr:hypothetical protein [Lentisphaerota bacterium]MBT4817520.1 hypothetical protein [Lentisphaerota bacterium]MBT5604985.1 hypothetical protein [Lentisphaerota bacterium]MBT7054615.1 hypothetical protein [Lentisphaerota bacterium]MBT7844644.1 hypothetical protein [Lentisphaerota bacterium]